MICFNPQEISPAAVWKLWKNQRITAGELMHYQRRAGGYFTSSGDWIKEIGA